jgi:asparagine synthase (glutamine-hydrolysing)
MCGIFGVWRLTDEIRLDEARFERALVTLDHRGPDARRVVKLGDQLLFGHTRLSIIDLDERSHQPMTLGGRYWIVYNGEIYNYLQLRRELEEAGSFFVTTSDTEVILHSYARWGEACVSRFNGMWAFSIYDKEKQTLFCSRDRFGEKPFNYAVHKGQFLFASEIKALLAYHPELVKPCYNSIANFCRTSVGAQQPQTWFEKVFRLEPGHNLTVRNGQLRTERYWRYPIEQERSLAFDDARERYAELFRDSVRVRMRSDVSLGVALSSGLDSSSIAYAMQSIDPQHHHCFTAHFGSHDTFRVDAAVYKQNVQIDESRGARVIADRLGLVHHAVETDYDDFMGDMQKIVFHLESGNRSPSVLPLMQLLRHAKEFVTVILDGQGADELLGGYTLEGVWPMVADLLANGRVGQASNALRQVSETYSLSYSIKMELRSLSNRINAISSLHNAVTGVEAVFGPELRRYDRTKDYMNLVGEGGSGALSKRLLQQHSGGLVSLLHYGDAISMMNGMEARMPFLDHRLVEFVWRLPSNWKINGSIGKYIHREAMRNVMPGYLVDQALKLGFNSPISQVFQSRVDLLEMLTEQRCVERGLFDRRGLERVIADHVQGRKDYGSFLFRLISTEVWFRLFVDQSAGSSLPAAVELN